MKRFSFKENQKDINQCVKEVKDRTKTQDLSSDFENLNNKIKEF